MHLDQTTLCTLDVPEALKEWSARDPRESWAAKSKGPRGEHFVVEVGVGGRKYGAFIDNGSTRNFISRDCVERLRLGGRVQRLSRFMASTLANNDCTFVHDYVKYVVCTFSYGGGELNHKILFLVSGDLPFDILLGMLKHVLSDARTVRLAKYKARRLRLDRRYGLHKFVVMSFGLCNMPGTFQHAVNRIFHNYLDKFIFVYLDILIVSKIVVKHAKHVDLVLGLLRQHKYTINLKKCESGRTKILYLGHELSAEGVKMEDAKVASIRDSPRPQSVTKVRSFLEMIGYYRNFVKNYSTTASPLTDLARLDTPWELTDDCERTFKRLKHALMHHEVLMLPDPAKPFIVTTDASQYGIGAVLAQHDRKNLKPIEYMSKKMPSKKLARSTYERELFVCTKL
ncbi:hypothetical protein CBR_g46272 [Chara braunii]|uniref:Reverse transcriptase domain-containing protein n=1 Tax=Chara braunii TaxID=69332 RepID=A0A388K3V5_CHABU|nr:hypothetical protein CBR_g46272 [Chara braunii]|eukprot:GBG64727.1 hypothetical protein CBR_g46272 [Chara braunii]